MRMRRQVILNKLLSLGTTDPHWIFSAFSFPSIWSVDSLFLTRSSREDRNHTKYFQRNDTENLVNSCWRTKRAKREPGTRDLRNCRKHQALRLEEWEEAVCLEPRSLERPCRGAGLSHWWGFGGAWWGQLLKHQEKKLAPGTNSHCIRSRATAVVGLPEAGRKQQEQAPSFLSPAASRLAPPYRQSLRGTSEQRRKVVCSVPGAHAVQGRVSVGWEATAQPYTHHAFKKRNASRS